MPNRYAEKIRRRREKPKDDETSVVIPQPSKKPVVIPQPSKKWFGRFFIVLLSAIGLLSYLAYSNNSPNGLIIPIAISVMLFLLLVIWYVPKFYVQSLPAESGDDFDRQKERLKLEDDTRKTFAQIVGGVVILGGLIFTYNTFRLQQDTYRLQQEGQLTDRFTKAVSQIGDEKLEVRLGGLYALERIANDSPKDYPTVMEILAAYIRENAKKKKNVEKSNANVNNAVNNAVTNTDPDNKNTADEQIYEKPTLTKVSTEVQTALTIIGRRKIEKGAYIDKINLSDADLSFANLRGANLQNADLRDSYLYHADLSGADLRNANLIRADLRSADLSRADLSGADLRSANLNLAQLHQAYLFTDLSSAFSLSFEQLSVAIIGEYTELPNRLASRKAELLEASSKNFNKRIDETFEEHLIEKNKIR